MADIDLPHPLLVGAARRAVAAHNPALVRQFAVDTAQRLLQPVVNATGVVLHTNLGRAPLAVEIEGRPHNLEIDLATGLRGSRQAAASTLLTALIGAEAALVVNNGAAAVLLALATIAAGRAVVVSRGELVEIGGGFRIPDVMAQSGCRLVEVGTTNRTRISDYEEAVSAESPALILKVHSSNYRISGFTQAVDVSELVGLGVPVMADLGSGLLDANTPWLPGEPPPWLEGEPAVAQTLASGANLVTFSGDKLLGGPQAGIIAGSSDLVAACGRHPLARALRPGSLILHSLQGVLLSYLRREAHQMPLWQMMTATASDLEERAHRIARNADIQVDVVECRSVMGGGSLPEVTRPSAGVAVAGNHTDRLRRHHPPVIAIARDGHTICDLRTVRPQDDAVVTCALAGSSSCGCTSDPL
ncbi:MAG TPA: L-seryl-tRNA(Sec) selenium transferase [Mycobacterium sp.]|nr:L-seryl-tRNA(Sec) selenium transferase [Mycobacterium sp.]